MALINSISKNQEHVLIKERHITRFITHESDPIFSKGVLRSLDKSDTESVRVCRVYLMAQY